MAGVCLYAAYTVLLSLLSNRVLGAGYGSTNSMSSLRFGGRFLGSCDMDGMYYMDQSSYVMCSHGIAYVMPCAPGTMNSGIQLQNLNAGDYLGFSAFCDVNLVDVGYAALLSQKSSGSGYGGSRGGASVTGYGATSSGHGGTSGGGYGSSQVRAKPSGTLVISYQPQSVPASGGYSQTSGYGQAAGRSTLSRMIRPVAISGGYQN